MKKSKKKLAFAAIFAAGAASAVMLTSCRPSTVYGPPPEDPEDPEIVETVYGPPEDFGYEEEVDPEFDPEGNEVEEVYGPPSWFGTSEEEVPEE